MGVHTFFPVSKRGEKSVGVHFFLPVLVRVGRAIVQGYTLSLSQWRYTLLSWVANYTPSVHHGTNCRKLSQL